MKYDIIIAGFGGQGILFSGQLLAYAAMLEGYEVSWLPSYGPEMRGGTANCNIVISDKRIRSPLIQNPKGLIAMNKPSLEKFEELVKEEGLIVVNSSMVDRRIKRKDIIGVEIPADEIANEIGSKQIANLVALGAFIGASGIVKVESLLAALKKITSATRIHLIDKNMEALEKGIEIGEESASKEE